MYERYYQLDRRPFDVTPSPRCLYLSKSHKEALAALIYGVTERRGFIALIGEVGTGKTTLINAALERLSENVRTAFIFNTDVSFNEILNMALVEFGLSDGEEHLSKVTALNRLNKYATKQFSEGANVVLIIDEAQNLDFQTMENLRLLSNLETSKYKLVQIVLSGQPELDEILRTHELRQLAQRINLRRYLLPLSEPETYEYIQQHLEEAGRKDGKLFDKRTLRLIWRYSRGVPRKINMLCDNALLIGYGLDKKKITESVVREAIKDFNASPYDENAVSFAEKEPFPPGGKKRVGASRIALAAGFVLLMIFLALGGVGFWPSRTVAEISTAVSNYLSDLINEDAVNKPSAPDISKTPGNRSAGPAGEALENPWSVEIIGSPETSASAGAAPDEGAKNVPVYQDGREWAAASSDRTPKGDDAKHMGEINRSADQTRPDLPAVNPSGKITASGDLTQKTSAFTSQEPYGKSDETSLRASNPSGDRTVSAQLAEPKIKSPNVAIKSSEEKIKRVRIREGDTLTRILERNYGSYEQMLPLVLRLNPQIVDPDIILLEDTIRLPSEVP
jgi:type II secretory pathway predicted ATPase ExeA